VTAQLRGLAGAALLAVLAACGGSSGASSGAAGAARPDATTQGWTGLTHPAELIDARLELMVRIEKLLQPIDLLEVEPVKDADALRETATTVAVMLHALPHLFPPTTNRYDPKAREPETIALPAIWDEFDSFHALGQASIDAAEAFAATKDDTQLKAAGAALRGTCDSCHARYLRRYEPPKVQEQDREFDFESALPPAR
jgi:cytochrome c556